MSVSTFFVRGLQSPRSLRMARPSSRHELGHRFGPMVTLIRTESTGAQAERTAPLHIPGEGTGNHSPKRMLPGEEGLRGAVGGGTHPPLKTESETYRASRRHIVCLMPPSVNRRIRFKSFFPDSKTPSPLSRTTRACQQTRKCPWRHHFFAALPRKSTSMVGQGPGKKTAHRTAGSLCPLVAKPGAEWLIGGGPLPCRLRARKCHPSRWFQNCHESGGHNPHFSPRGMT